MTAIFLDFSACWYIMLASAVMNTSNSDWRLACSLPQHDVKTVRQMGGSSYANGQLVTVAESEFEVFITADANMIYQQALKSRKIAVIVLRPRRNRLPEILSLLPQLLTALDSCAAGAFFEVQVQ